MEGVWPAVPPDAAVLAELLLERLGAAVGNWRIELFATDGRIRRYTQEEQGGRDQLARRGDTQG